MEKGIFIGLLVKDKVFISGNPQAVLGVRNNEDYEIMLYYNDIGIVPNKKETITIERYSMSETTLEDAIDRFKKVIEILERGVD